MVLSKFWTRLHSWKDLSDGRDSFRFVQDNESETGGGKDRKLQEDCFASDVACSRSPDHSKIRFDI